MENFLQQLSRGNALLLIVILGLGGSFQSGYHITGLSSPSPFIQRFINSSWSDRYKESPPPETVTMIWSLVISMHAVGGLCGAASVKFVDGLLGRKRGVICNSYIAIVAGIIMLTSRTANSFEMVIVARVLYGITTGLGTTYHITYLGEICPKKLRGRVTLTFSNFLSFGKLSGQLFGLSEILGHEDLWHFTLALPSCFAVIQVLALPFLPDSPRYLFIEKGDKEACKKALQNLWGPGDYSEEMDEMLSEQAVIRATPPKSSVQLLGDATVRWQLVTMCLIYWFNQLSGMSSISTFSFDILLESGVPEDKIRYVILALGVCEIITSMAASPLIERIGRRPLFWGSYGFMAALWVSILITQNLKGSNSWVSYVITAMVFLIIMFFCGGSGAATGTLCSELFIQSNRLSAYVIVGLVRWTAVALIGFAFPFLISSLGSYSFVLFACVCLLGSLYTFFILPETKGKTLLEISEEFEAIRMCRKSVSVEERTETKL